MYILQVKGCMSMNFSSQPAFQKSSQQVIFHRESKLIQNITILCHLVQLISNQQQQRMYQTAIQLYFQL